MPWSMQIATVISIHFNHFYCWWKNPAPAGMYQTLYCKSWDKLPINWCSISSISSQYVYMVKQSLLHFTLMFSFLKAEMWPTCLTWLTWKPWYLPRPSNKVHASRWEGQIFHCHQVDLSGRWSIDCFTPCGGCQYWITLGWCGEEAVHRLTYVEYRELVDLHLWSGQPNPNPEFIRRGLDLSSLLRFALLI